MNFGLKVWFVSLHLETLNFSSVYVKHLVCFQNVKHFCTPWSLLALSLHKMCPNTEFFLVRIQENKDQKNSVYGHFSRSVSNFFNFSIFILSYSFSYLVFCKPWLFWSKMIYHSEFSLRFPDNLSYAACQNVVRIIG